VRVSIQRAKDNFPRVRGEEFPTNQFIFEQRRFSEWIKEKHISEKIEISWEKLGAMRATSISLIQNGLKDQRKDRARRW